MGTSHKKKSKKQAAIKLSVKKHILPPLAGIFVMASILAFFNSQFLAAKLIAQTQASKSATISELPPDDTAIDPEQEPRIIIQKIGVKAPVVLDVKQANEDQFQLALQRGVVHYPGTAQPGEPGNVVLFGHSSGQVWAPGDYKFVFTRLEQLKVGDTILVEFNGTRYSYVIENTEVVHPSDVSVLAQDKREHTLTLITCTPVGTNLNRFIVHAVQTKPEPAPEQDRAPAQSHVPEVNSLPSSTSPSVWASIRSFFN